MELYTESDTPQSSLGSQTRLLQVGLGSHGSVPSEYSPKPAEGVDEDGVTKAGVKYSTMQEFQEKIYAIAKEALELAENRNAKNAPAYGGDHA